MADRVIPLPPRPRPTPVPSTTQEQQQGSIIRGSAYERYKLQAQSTAPATYGPVYVPPVEGEKTWFNDNILTRIWTDDFSQTPVVGMGFANLGKAYQWTMDHRNQSITWGLAHLPGGVQTDVSWDDAARIHPGRMWAAMGVQETDGKDGYYRWAAAKQREIKEWQTRPDKGSPSWLMDNPGTLDHPREGVPGLFVPKGWDITNPADEKWLFGDPEDPLAPSSPQDEQANTNSFLVALPMEWFLDPLVVAGKGVKVARLGSTVFGADVVGQSVRYTNSQRATVQIEKELDDFRTFLATEGKEGALRGAGKDALNFADRSGKELRGERWARGAYVDDILDVADLTDNPDDAAIIFGALVGSKKYVGLLHEKHQSVADAFASLKRPNAYEMAAGNAPVGMPRPPILSEMIESSVTGDGVLTDLMKKDKALAKALGLMSESSAPIEQVAGRLNTGRLGQTWRAGRAARDTRPTAPQRISARIKATQDYMRGRSAKTLEGDTADYNQRAGNRADQYGPQTRPNTDQFSRDRALTDAGKIATARFEASLGPNAWEGGPRLYHGSANPIPGDTLFGTAAGFNTTGLSSLARKAASKGKKGVVYNVTWADKKAPVILDGKAPATDRLRKAARKVIDTTPGSPSYADPTLTGPSLFPRLHAATGPRARSSTISVLKAAQRDLKAAGASTQETERVLGRLRAALKKDGFDAVEHDLGGTPTTTFLNPKKLRIVKNDTAGTQLKPAEQILDEEIVPLTRAFTPNRVTEFDPSGSIPAVYERVYQLSRNFRQVAVWEWINGQRGSGWLTVRGMEDGYAQDEWKAALRESRVLRRDGDFVKRLVMSWSHGTSEVGNLERAAEIEHTATIQMARHYFGAESADLQESIATGIYRAAAKKRQDALTKFQESKGTAFGIDPETGKIITVGPLMRTQLETKIPLLDFRLMDKVMQELAKPAMKPYLREIADTLIEQAGGNTIGIATKMGSISEGAKWGLEGINSAWKAAVLMRLGYTQRNVFEGWLRTWAVLGMVPALAPSNIAHGVARTFYSNPRAKRTLAKIEGVQKEMSKIIEQERSFQMTLEQDVAELAARSIPEPADLRVALDRSTLKEHKELGGGTFYTAEYDPANSTTLRSVATKEELPDYLYHVTTNSNGVARDGALRMSKGQGGGLGGSASKNNVSLTTDRATALQIRDDLRLYASIRQLSASNSLTPEELIDLLKAELVRYGGDPENKALTPLWESILEKSYVQTGGSSSVATEAARTAISNHFANRVYMDNPRVQAALANPESTIGDIIDSVRKAAGRDGDTETIIQSMEHQLGIAQSAAIKTYPRGARRNNRMESVWADVQTEFFAHRRSHTPMHPEHPGIFQQQALGEIAAEDINIIAIPKRNIPDNAVIENIGHGRMGEHSEVRVYGDIPIGKAQLSDVKNRVVYDDMMARAMNELDDKSAELEDYVGVVQELARKKQTLGKKYIGWDEAFAGPMGEIRRANASNQQTVKNFFESKAARDAQLQHLDDRKWREVRPDEEQYFDELSGAAIQFRADALGVQALRPDASVESMMDWFKTDAGKKYATDMALFDEQDQLRRATFLATEAKMYFPDDAMALAAREGTPPTGAEFRTVLGGRKDLSVIHGREVKAHTTSEDPYHATINTIFKYLGSMPDSALVRQPFYNEVWKRETGALYQKAIAQGEDVSDPAVLRRIEETAHRRSLQATNDTLFTITRYSNPAAALRFLSPFFAAWENSMRTWARIIINDPSVAARGMILWDLPNNLGLTVDENGEPVGSAPGDFLSGSVNQFIVMPKFMTDWWQENLTKLSENPALKGNILGDVVQGAGQFPLKIPKGSFNIVAPGESPFLPGMGPVVTYPVGNVLASKPDVQAWLKSTLGDAVYSQIAPFGQASPDIVDTVFPAAARKGYTLFRGEDSDDYMRILDAVTVDAIVQWRISGGRKEDMPDPAAIKEYADNFLKFSTLASLTLPVSITRMSDYQPILNAWRQMSSDPTLTYRDAVSLFIEKYGDAFMPLTQSTSKSDIEGLDPSMEMWKEITNHAREVQMLTGRVGDDGASILAATIPNGEFNPAVHSYWRNERQPGSTSTYKTAMTAEEIITEDVVGSMWTEYIKEKTMRDNALAKLGTSTYDSAVARDAGITDMWDTFVDGMYDKYGLDYTNHGPPSYTKKIGQVLGGVKMLLQDEQFMSSDLGKSSTWLALKDYMAERDQAMAAIQKGADRKEVLEIFNSYTADHKYASLQFSDFFDMYLENDDLQVRVEGN